ncbi:zinc-dependent metalloprotease [Candidatus Sumerlaeota bacterium]|nr:zinc-dependent metalloprotease [Candidatus Sumerlaeota bacterium]
MKRSVAIFILLLITAAFSACITINRNPAEAEPQPGAQVQAEDQATSATATADVKEGDQASSPSAQTKQPGQPQPPQQQAPGAQQQQAAAQNGAAKGKIGKAFDDVIKDHEKIEGFFTFYWDKEQNSLYMEILPSQLDTMYLCSVSRDRAESSIFHSAEMMQNFPFEFRRVGRRIQMLHKNVYFRADKDAAFSRAVERDKSDSIVASANVECDPHPERRSILVNAAALFMRDPANVQKLGVQVDMGNSFWALVKSYPENSEVQVTLNFNGQGASRMDTIPEDDNFFHTYHYSLHKLPDSDYKPRPADERVGVFYTMYQDYTSLLREEPYVRLVRRWNLQKAEPRFELSPPKKPIVWWIENTVPVEYRDTVKAGVLEWNKAFEKIGFKDPIEVKQMPDDADWEAGDSRYNVIRWMMLPEKGIAVGPAHSNPLTGEIYSADIRFSAEWVRFAYTQYERLADPLHGDAEAEAAAMGPGHWDDPMNAAMGYGSCNYGAYKSQEAAFAWDVLAARAAADGTEASVSREDFVKAVIFDVICHEVGHTLGLAHNFKGSSAYTMEQLQDPEFTRQNGISASIMDYTPISIFPKSEKQGEYWQSTVGPYDCWAIEYAYSEPDPDSGESEGEMLKRILSKAGDPMLVYGSDMDVRGGAMGIDPKCQLFDLGADAVEWREVNLKIGQELLTNMSALFEKQGQPYNHMRIAFSMALYQYRRSVDSMCAFIGGIDHTRVRAGDPGERLPFEPVSPEEQQRALAFLKQHVFSVDALRFDPVQLKKLAPSYYYTYSGEPYNDRIDYPVHTVIAEMHQDALNQLFDPLRLQRVLDLELYVEEGGASFSIADIFNEVRGAVWSELDGPQNVNAYRRSLQRMHAQKMIDLMLASYGGAPYDAKMLARASLRQIRDGIAAALQQGGMDALTRAHWSETQDLIRAALEAQISRESY